MFKNKYFSHYSPTGISPWDWIDKSGYDYYYAGENLAMNFLDTEEVIKGWLNSPSHRENLLNKDYKDMGIAVVSGDFNNEGINRILVVQMFGSKAKPSIPVAMAQTPHANEPPPQEKIQATTTTLALSETTETTETTIQTIVGVAGEQAEIR